MVLRAFLGLGLGLSFSCTNEKSCTTIGCTDELSLNLFLADGSEPKFDLSLVVDGKTIACPAPALGSSARCDDGVSVGLAEIQACMEDASGTSRVLKCSGTGRFRETLIIQGAPASVTVSITQGGTARSLGTFSPSYQSVQPNGPGCDPICRQVTIAQVIDTWP